MTELIAELLDSAQLLVDLQQVNEIAHSLSGGRSPETIAQTITDALSEKFDCAFSRIWLVETDGIALKLVASSGLHTRTDGCFAKVPMGAFKVGKIAQNRVAFLSNNLPEETWVKDRDWAIAHKIQGFAGFPLIIEERVVGVLATFSHEPLSPEFLEVLRVLCTLAAVALDSAIVQQQPIQVQSANHLPLSDQLAGILSSTPLTLSGTEQALPLSSQWIFLNIAEILEALRCNYCWLTYGAGTVELTAIIAAPKLPAAQINAWINSALKHLLILVSYLDGSLDTQLGPNATTVQVQLMLPTSSNLHRSSAAELPLCIQCQQPILQSAFTQLAYRAGLTVVPTLDDCSPLLTDDLTYCSANQPILWVQTAEQRIPKQVRAKVNLSIQAADLRKAVEAVMRGEEWGFAAGDRLEAGLSEREVETIKLLAKGMRDRDIAETLFISESTVKFHLNNVVGKLKAKTRYQALYQAVIHGWI